MSEARISLTWNFKNQILATTMLEVKKVAPPPHHLKIIIVLVQLNFCKNFLNLIVKEESFCFVYNMICSVVFWPFRI